MKKLLIVLCVGVGLLGMVGFSNASLMFYTDETSYLSDLAMYGCQTFFEGFEGAAWSGVRYPTVVPSITVNEIEWASNEGLSTIDSFWARSGTYGLYTKNYDDALDSINISSSTKSIYGIGGWFANSNAVDLTINVGDREYFALSFPDEWTEHIFFGLIDTKGFTNVDFYTNGGNFGADDFTFATSVPTPEPATMLLLSSGLLGLSGFRRKFRKK
jgi:hypothetical protein